MVCDHTNNETVNHNKEGTNMSNLKLYAIYTYTYVHLSTLNYKLKIHAQLLSLTKMFFCCRGFRHKFLFAASMTIPRGSNVENSLH